MTDLTIRKAHPIVEAGYKLSLAEQRIVLLSLAQLDNRDITQRKVTLFAKDYSEKFNVPEKVAYRDLLNASKRLYDRSIILKGEDETTEFRWIESRTKYHTGEGRISFEFSRRVLPYLFDLDKRLGYTQYHLLSVSGFSSSYSIRLYELCKKLQGMQNQNIEIDEIRRILQIDDKYKEFKVLKRDVLSPSFLEINEKSDLLVKVEPLKRGRSIVALKFTINPKSSAVDIGEDLTKDGLTKLPQRPQVKAGSQQEWDYWRECLRIRNADYDRLKAADIRRPTKLLADLEKYNRKLGDTLKADELKEIIEKRKKNGTY